MQFPDDGNGDMLRALMDAGIDLSQPLAIDFYLVFKNKDQAEKAMAALVASELQGEVELHFNDLEQARKAAEEDYCGCYSSLSDYAQELTEETTSIPQHLAMYIDYRAMARDMEYSGDVFTLEAGFEQVHVFWNR